MAYISFQPNDFFNTKLWTGTGSENAITGIGFQPDFTWIKNRAATENHKLYDAVRGVTKNIYSNLTNAEGTDAQSLKSFDSDGFTLGTESALNANGQNIVGWNWKANGAGSANTDGSINTTSTSVNTTAGFSISKYTGTGSAATVGHGLGSAPEVIIVKRLDSTSDWSMYWKVLGTNKYIYLNDTAAVATDSSSEFWNNTAPTSTVFSVKSAAYTNGSGNTYVAYCFAPKTGFSKFGEYAGNGNDDGPFIYTGFKPAMIILKRKDSADGWFMYDTKRSPINVMDDYLLTNANSAEVGTSAVNIDFVSNGFKLRNDDGGHNNSSGTYIYLAFAEEPLVASNGTPATAR